MRRASIATRRSSLVLAVLAALACVGLMTGARPARAKPPAYQHFVACGLGRHAKPSRVCRRRRPQGAFFRARQATVHYTVCVRFPGGRTLCAKHQEAERGVLYVNAITTSQLGPHRVTWFVEGRRVGRFFFRLRR